MADEPATTEDVETSAEEVMAALAGETGHCSACDDVPDEHGGYCAECLRRWVMGDNQE